MRYTKYKYKKNNEGGKLIISILLTIAVAVAIGNFGARWIINKLPQNFTSKSNEVIEETINTPEEKENKEVIYSVIQSGYFSKLENANHILTKLSDFKNAFIFEDDNGKFRVIVDVVKSEDSENILALLKEQGIDSAKVDYSIKEGEDSEGYITEIIKGQFEIINTFKDETVKEIDILEFKEWVKGLELSKEAINQGENISSEDISNIDIDLILDDYKEYIENLPNKIEREGLKSQIEKIYSIIINLKK